MSVSMWQQLATVKASVLELVNVLIEEDEDNFTREQSVLDLLDIVKDLHHLEELSMSQVDKVDRLHMIERADLRDQQSNQNDAFTVLSNERALENQKVIL